MNTAIKQLTDDRKEQLQELINAVNEECKGQYEYYTENEDAAEPLYYFDWEVRIDSLTDSARELVDQFLAIDGNELADLKDYCDLEATGIYISDNEICSYVLGEIEVQLSDDIHAALHELSPAEFEYVQRKVSEGYLSNSQFAYIDGNYDRWVLVLDEEQLAEALTE